MSARLTMQLINLDKVNWNGGGANRKSEMSDTDISNLSLRLGISEMLIHELMWTTIIVHTHFLLRN